MHRTQIYLQDALHEQLKRRARSVGVRMSELIRRTLEKEKDIEKDTLADAKAFFERLQPLQSFADADAQTYVQSLRKRSRILHKEDK